MPKEGLAPETKGSYCFDPGILQVPTSEEEASPASQRFSDDNTEIYEGIQDMQEELVPASQDSVVR